MFTLVTLICSISSGNCIINTPHKYPYFHPPYTSIAACTNEGYKSKDVFTKFYIGQGKPSIIRFRCINWGKPV